MGFSPAAVGRMRYIAEHVGEGDADNNFKLKPHKA